MASRYSLRGPDRFPKDLLPDPVLKGVRRHEIHRGLKKVLEVVFQADEIEQADRLGKFHEDLDVAAGHGFVPRHGAEEGDRLHRKPAKLLPAGRKYSQYTISCHGGRSAAV